MHSTNTHLQQHIYTFHGNGLLIAMYVSHNRVAGWSQSIIIVY